MVMDHLTQNSKDPKEVPEDQNSGSTFKNIYPKIHQTEDAIDHITTHHI